ncbi:MAG TPA: M42 family metallopeptidase [Firmicutes bacterium]|nr:M42 family metallopeptidase [Bacillota bacterium]
MDLAELLKALSESSGISGYENMPAEIISKNWSKMADEVRRDALGNVIAVKKGKGHGKLLLAAHIDEIGLMVKKIDEKGFIRFATVGGFDYRTLVAQEVTVHGKEKLRGVIGAKPPHLQARNEQKKAYPEEEFYIDLGLDVDKVKELVRIGDVITIERSVQKLAGQRYAGKSFDDRACVVMLTHCLERLTEINHNLDVYLVATVQEEVGTRGAAVATYGIDPDLGIAVDVCHGEFPGVRADRGFTLGKGPVISMGPDTHPKILEKMKEVADEAKINYQLEASTSAGGTDAWSIQVARSGVACALLSLPLRYMHTSVETLDLADIKEGGRLLAEFALKADRQFVEGLPCF